MNKCPNCKYTVKEGDRYCHRCGTDLSAVKSSVPAGDGFTRMKSLLTSWFYGGIQTWKKSPVFFLGFGLALMFLLLIPGIRIVTVVASGLIIAAFYRSQIAIKEGEMPTYNKLETFLKPLWSYFLLVQIVNILFVLIVAAIHWAAVIFILPFIMFTIPLSADEPQPLGELFERAYNSGKENYPILLTLSFIVVLGNYLTYSFIPFLLFITLPFTFIFIFRAYCELGKSSANDRRDSGSATYLITN